MACADAIAYRINSFSTQCYRRRTATAAQQSQRIGHAPARTSRVLPDRAPPAAETSRRAPPRAVAGALARGLGHLAPDGAYGDHASAGRAYAARSSQLDLARVWHAGRLLAAQAHAGTARRGPDRDAQWPRLRDLSAGGRSLHRERLGTQRPRLRADPHASGG